MRTKNVTFVDGTKTREEIGKTGKNLTELCKEKGIPQATVSRICINGYGNPKIIEKAIAAGIPIVPSNKPIQSRTKVEYSRTYRRNSSDNEPKQKTIEQAIPKQMRIEDLTGAEQIKELLISHLTALIEDLKKI